MGSHCYRFIIEMISKSKEIINAGAIVYGGLFTC